MSKESFASKEKINILNRDKIILEKGLQELFNYLKKTYEKNPEELPKTLIFPETFSRLLVYVVKPLFDYFYRQHHLSPPTIIFIRTPKHGTKPSELELHLLKERAEEIKSKLHLRRDDKVLIIDDFYFQGGTFKLISEAFKKSKPHLKIEGFFFITDYYSDLPKNCFYGMERSFNFSFYYDSYSYVGVSKKEPRKYPQKISDFNPQVVAFLRKALAKIGLEFVNSLKERNSL